MEILVELDMNLAEMNTRWSQKRNKISLKISANWVTPIHLLALAARANYLGLNISSQIDQIKTRSYLNRIKFPSGTRDLSSSGTVIPLTMLDTKKDDNLLSAYEDRILKEVSPEYRSSFRNTLVYMTSELTTNIREHSRSKHYWILAQHWPKTKTCEIAIADTGIGYLESYKGTHYEVEDHHAAIQNALHGRSSKNNIERGAGIPSTVRIFTEGYGGKVVVATGDAIQIIQNGKTEPYKLRSHWNGTLIGIQFDMKNVNIHPYLGGY